MRRTVWCYRNNPNPVESFNVTTNFDLQGDGLVWWYARPQLFFTCILCPTGAKGTMYSAPHNEVVYFSTFEPINLTPDSIMQLAGVPVFYRRLGQEPAPALSLHLSCREHDRTFHVSSAATVTP